MILQIMNTQDTYNLMPLSIIEEITQNIKLILTTIKGTVPLDRNFGIDISFLDNPIPKAVMRAKISILETVKKYEPRVEVLKVELINDALNIQDGKVTVKVEVKILDEYIE